MPSRQRNSLCQTWLKPVGLAVAAVVACAVAPAVAHGQQTFTAPVSPRRVYSLDANWKFFKETATKAHGAEAPAFDDSRWETVSTPHTYNDVDSFRTIISHSGGDRGVWKGTAWYRRHFRITDSASKVYVEFEGMRQAGEIFLNGKAVGLSENGITAYGVDITGMVKLSGLDNVLAVHVDNRTEYAERASGTRFQWNVNDFNPNYGGINRHVRLHLTGPIYQTLPLFDGLKTTGVYIYPTNIAVPQRTADITAESQVHNASPDHVTVALSTVLVDAGGLVHARFQGDGVDIAAGERTVLKATGPLREARFWSVDDPYLYDVYTMLTVGGKVVDVNKVTTGFRKTAFKGGAGQGGVFLNDKFVYLKGFAQRASNEWAGLGQAYPDWMHDLTAQLIRAGHGNYIRWMHVTPQKVDVESCDRFGIVQIAPGGDKERAVQGRQWEQRLEVMTASIIYLRNSPSILCWEAGNTGIPAAQMQQMVDLKKKWDPHGGRAMGCRTLNDPATTPIAEYFGVMIGQDPKTDALKTPTAMFRAYSAERRDRAPLIETEDFRDEGARRFWDDYSPPYFGFKKGPNDTYAWNSETFALAAAGRYWAYWKNRISNVDPAHSKWSGYASIYFSDSNADGRQQSSEVARVSGKVDAVRIPKPIYFAHRVMQSLGPDLHILGHWNYPEGTRKTVYVIANTQTVELRLNGRLLGKLSTPKDGYVFAFSDIKWEAGALTAIGYNEGREVCQHELTTVGAAKRIKLTPVVGPAGLLADGADVALIDVEVVDDQGRRCPTDDARVDFTVAGPAVWRGGYNSGRPGSTNNLYLNTECGINRVAVRSTLKSGTITVTASRDGLQTGTVRIEARAVTWNGDFVDTPQNRLAVGKIEIIAGSDKVGYAGDGGQAKTALFNKPFHCDLDGAGNLYVADTMNGRIRKIDLKNGIINTVAGNGAPGSGGDGGPALQASIQSPYAVAVQSQTGDFYIVEQTTAVVRKVDGKTGIITTVAGNGRKGFGGDGGKATEAMLREPNDCCLDGRGGLLIADVADWRIRRLDLKTGIITTFAGTGKPGQDGKGTKLPKTVDRSKIGDGGKATDAVIVGARAVCVDGKGNTYICEREGNAIRKIDQKGTITTIAGTGAAGYSGDGANAAKATFKGPKGVRCDFEGNIYVVDSDNHAIRKIDVATNVVTTVAGGRQGTEVGGGDPFKAGLDKPHGCVLDKDGTLYIADSWNNRICRVSFGASPKLAEDAR